MTTERQRAANIENAKRSTGPRTSEGKARSARNAETHGVYAADLNIPRGSFAEDEEPITALIASIRASIDPRNGVEVALTDDIIGLILKSRRLREFEREGIAGLSPTRATMATMTPDPIIGDIDEYRREQSVAGIVTFLENMNRLETSLGRQVKQKLELIVWMRGDSGSLLVDSATPRPASDDGSTASESDGPVDDSDASNQNDQSSDPDGVTTHAGVDDPATERGDTQDGHHAVATPADHIPNDQPDDTPNYTTAPLFPDEHANPADADAPAAPAEVGFAEPDHNDTPNDQPEPGAVDGAEVSEP